MGMTIHPRRASQGRVDRPPTSPGRRAVLRDCGIAAAGAVLSTAHLSGAAAAPSAVTGTVYPVLASIPSDGSVDVTAALLAFFASVPDGQPGSPSLIDFPSAPAVYRIDGTLRIQNRANLSFLAHGAAFKAVTLGNRTRSQWAIIDSTNIALVSVAVIGANPHAGTYDDSYNALYEAQHAFDIRSSQGVTIDRCTACDLWGDFVYVGCNGPSNAWSEDVTVLDGSFGRNGRQGVTVTGARRVTFDGCGMGAIRRSAICIEPNSTSGGAEDVTVSNCRIGSHRLNWLTVAGAGGAIRRLTIRDNTMTGSSMNTAVAASPGPREDFAIYGNTSNVVYGDPDGFAMNFAGVNGLSVYGNVQPLAPGRRPPMQLAEFVSCTDVTYVP